MLIEQIANHCWALFVALVSNGKVEALCELKMLSLVGRQNSPSSGYDNLMAKPMHWYLHLQTI